MLSGEEKMWRAVIATAVSDALSNRISKADRREALDWIFGGDDYFELACDMGNISPERVRKEFLREKIRKTKNI
jgi:predicted GTPase